MSTVTMPSTKPNLVTETLRVVVPLLILVAGFSFFLISGSLKQTAKAPPKVASPPRVETMKVVRYEGNLQIDIDGTVVPFREMTLTSEVAGRVQRRHELCQAGRFVKQGTILLEIDPRDYELEIKQLEQEILQTQAALTEIDVQLENLDSLEKYAEDELNLQLREVKRLTRLVGDQTVAQSDLDRARSGEVLARNASQRLANERRVLAAKRASTTAALELVKTRKEQAQLNLTRTRIVAPVDGVVVQDLVEENDFVQRGTPVVEFEDTSAVEVKCNLVPEEIAWLARARHDRSDDHLMYEPPRVPAKVIYERGSEQFEWDGVLARYDGIGMDERTRMVACRILVDDPGAGRPTGSVDDPRRPPPSNPSPMLMRGMFVRVVIDVPTASQLAWLPRTAVQLGDEVWRVVDDKLQIVPVTIARRTADGVILNVVDAERSLQIGDRAVVSPLATVYEGMEVTMAVPDTDELPNLSAPDRMPGADNTGSQLEEPTL